MIVGLHQVIALVKGKKSRATEMLTKQHHGWKTELLAGIARSYKPLTEDGAQLPPESQQVQKRVDHEIAKIQVPLAAFYDIVATQEKGNTQAVASIVVENRVLVDDVPVGVLLFLEKQLVSLQTYISSLPVLDSSAAWKWDDNRGCYATEPTQTMKTAKVPTPIVLAEATPEHPAQVQMGHTDTPMGMWTTTHLSGAIPMGVRDEMLEKARELLCAVKVARETANATEVEDFSIGGRILGFIFGDVLKK